MMSEVCLKEETVSLSDQWPLKKKIVLNVRIRPAGVFYCTGHPVVENDVARATATLR